MPTQTAAVKIDTSADDFDLISRIANRAVEAAKDAGHRVKKIDVMMDLSAVHENGNPLRLADLLAADEFNFAHDVFGIRQHLDRTTGKLGNHFSPRFSARAAA